MYKVLLVYMFIIYDVIFTWGNTKKLLLYFLLHCGRVPLACTKNKGWHHITQSGWDLVWNVWKNIVFGVKGYVCSSLGCWSLTVWPCSTHWALVSSYVVSDAGEDNVSALFYISVYVACKFTGLFWVPVPLFCYPAFNYKLHHHFLGNCFWLF